MTSGVYKRTEKHKKRIKDNHWSKTKNKEKIIKKLSETRKRKIANNDFEVWNKNKKGVQVAWNKNLTKETDKRIKKQGEKLSINIKNGDANSGFKKGYTPYNKGKPQTKKWIEMRKKLILPKKDSSIEIKIQNFLKELNIEFFTHQYMKIEHGYQCDILIPSLNLIIECDGDYWHKYPVGREIDNIRTRELIEKGFKVLRLWEHEIRKITINDFKRKIK